MLQEAIKVDESDEMIEIPTSQIFVNLVQIYCKPKLYRLLIFTWLPNNYFPLSPKYTRCYSNFAQKLYNIASSSVYLRSLSALIT